MTLTDRLVVHLRALKLSLVAGGVLRRKVVPVLEVLETWLTDGFAAVLTRVKLRFERRTVAAPRAYTRPPGMDEPLPPLRIPPMRDAGCVSVVIPVLDKAAVTHNCLCALIQHTVAGSYEAIVVDNGSGDATREMLASVDGLRVIRNDTNLGFVDACNRAARVARGEFVVFLNNDTAVLPGWLDALTSTLKRDPRAGAVGAKLLYPDGRLQEAGSIIWSDGSGWNYGRGEDPEAPEFNYVREVDYCSGACLMVRRRLFEEIGGFDSRYSPAYYEDTDLCFRLRERGYRVLYQPASQVVHLEGGTAGTDLSSGFKRYQQPNRLVFVERHSAALAKQHAPKPRLVRYARDRRNARSILVVDHMLPHHDEDAGSLRMAAILRILADLGHRVTFLPDNLARVEPYATELQQVGIEVLYGPMSTIAYVKRHATEYDVVVLCRAHVAAKYIATVLGAARRPFLIFDSVDINYLREQRRATSDPAISRSAERTRSVELSLMHASDMVWVTSTYEAELLRACDVSLHVEIVPIIHDVRSDVPPFVARRDLIFVGGFRHPPNEDAVLYFVHDVFPLVKRELPDVHLVVVGSNVPPRVAALESSDIRVLGHVKDLEPVLDRCLVSVAPLRYGAGVKGKISQSLAWGLPVVTTPVGAEGMDLEHGTHVMIASDPSEFARHVIEVYRDEALWTRLSGNGRCHVEARFGYESIRTKLDALISAVSPVTPERHQVPSQR